MKAGDDFYKFAIGSWIATNQIPADRTSWNSFTQLSSIADEQVRTIIQNLPPDAAQGSIEQKVGDYYRAYLDTAAIEAAGIEPIKPVLAGIAAAHTHADIARLLGRPDLRIDSPINMAVTIDQKNPDRYVVVLVQGGLGLPEREYYLRQDASLAAIRAKYLAHIGRMLALVGEKNSRREAQRIFDLETQMAQLHWPIAKRRDRVLTYNLRTRVEVEALAPKFPWAAMLGEAGVNTQQDYIVREIDAIQALGKLFALAPVSTWRSYLRYHYLAAVAEVLPKAFDDERFDFYGRVLAGQKEQKDRWKRSVAAVGQAVGEGVGQLYVKQYFPPESKAEVKALVEDLRKAYGERIRNVPWMTPETREAALEKLATFRPKIGYPDKWRDYSALEVKPGDAFGNLARYALFDWKHDVDRLPLPTDREEWGMTPQTINAYYNSVFNEIVFPAAILQAPFFDPNADPAVNYGAIGAVIGHEMGHGFDDQGAKSDARGVLRTWWKPEDEAAFKKLTDQLSVQYDGYEALPGLKLNGRLTLGENIGDLGGVNVAYEAYKISLQGKPAAVLDGLTGDQRFFLSYAQVWRSLMRDESLRNQVMSDPHSPARFRVNGVVRNMDPWYSAFDVKQGDGLYLAPAERIRIW